VTPRSRGGTFRLVLCSFLMPVGAVAVHQLRYLLAYGSDAGRELAEQGDSYVHSLTPWLVAAVAVAIGATIAHWVASPRPGRNAKRRPLWQVWALASVSMLLAYTVQEGLEVVLGSAHTSVWNQAYGDGGWWAVPAALAVGFAWSLLARGAAFIAERLGGRARGTTRGSVAPPDPIQRARPSRRPRFSPLAGRSAGRGPPVVIRTP
jgi:hypothetical protein